MPSKSTSSPLIKRYLPVRLTLPSWNEKDTNETFFFVTEHRATPQQEQATGTATLFLANTPFIPGVETKLLLQSIFGQYGKVSRVTLMGTTRTEDAGALVAATHMPEPSFFTTIQPEGKFAHVVFDSKNDMKRAMRSLREIMISEEELPGLRLEIADVRALKLETERQQIQNSEEEEDDTDEQESRHVSLKGIAAVAERWRSSHRALSRSALLEECNAVMESFENAEDEERHSRQAGDEPDEDGFVTVSYAAQSAESKRELGETSADFGRRKVAKRSRKKKEGIGATELPDFYRFQMKQSRMKNLHDLRKRFEEDLDKVKKIQQNRQYKPF